MRGPAESVGPLDAFKNAFIKNDGGDFTIRFILSGQYYPDTVFSEKFYEHRIYKCLVRELDHFKPLLDAQPDASILNVSLEDIFPGCIFDSRTDIRQITIGAFLVLFDQEAKILIQNPNLLGFILHMRMFFKLPMTNLPISEASDGIYKIASAKRTTPDMLRNMVRIGLLDADFQRGVFPLAVLQATYQTSCGLYDLALLGKFVDRPVAAPIVSQFWKFWFGSKHHTQPTYEKNNST